VRRPLTRPDLRLAACLLLALLALPLLAGTRSGTAQGAAASLTPAGAAAPLRAAGTRFPVDGLVLGMARRAADAHWGTPACRGQVAITWTTLAPGTNATATWHNPTDAWANAGENFDCAVALNTEAAFDAPKLCAVLMHEFGHLHGIGHSEAAGELMSAVYTTAPEPCRALTGAAGAAGPGHAAVALRAVSRASRARARRCARPAARGRAAARCRGAARSATRSMRRGR